MRNLALFFTLYISPLKKEDNPWPIAPVRAKRPLAAPDWFVFTADA